MKLTLRGFALNDLDTDVLRTGVVIAWTYRQTSPQHDDSLNHVMKSGMKLFDEESPTHDLLRDQLVISQIFVICVNM